MESKDLKIAAGSIIAGSKISKAAKLQLLDFIQSEATDHQIMALLLDGKVVKLDEQAEQVVEDRFNNSKLSEGIAGGIFAIAALQPAWPVWRGILAATSKANRKCGVLRITNQRDVCMAKVRLDETGKKIKLLGGLLKQCSKSGNPKNCKSRIETNIAKLNKKLYNQKAKLIKVQQKMAKRGKEPEAGVKQAQTGPRIRI